MLCNNGYNKFNHTKNQFQSPHGQPEEGPQGVQRGAEKKRKNSTMHDEAAR